MNDTKPETYKIVADMMMRRTGVERLKMGLSMFDMAKELVTAGIISSGNSNDMRKELLLRFYKNDLDPLIISTVLQAICKVT